MNSFILLIDISGFTNFVNQTEIEHGAHIISELLELVIDADELCLKVAEVEGDAVFFYCHQTIPSKENLMRQVEKTFVAFHAHLKLYETRRVCHCGACSNAPNLSLKFIAHASDFGFISVKGNTKPYGAGIIVAHRLMKNNVPIKDYVLLSEHLQENWTDAAEVLKLVPQCSDYSDIGPVHYHYSELTYLKDAIPIPKEIPTGNRTNQPVVHEIELPFPISQVYQTLVSMEDREKWIPKVEKIDYDPKDLNRLGAKHQCIVDGQDIEFKTVTGDFGIGKLVYGEQTSSIPLVKESTNYFILEEMDNGNTRLVVEIHFKKHPFMAWLFTPIFKRLVSKGLSLSLAKFKELLEVTTQAMMKV